jgi:phage-related protein
MAYKIYFHRTERGERRVRSFVRKLPYKARRKCRDYLHRIRVQGPNANSSVLKHIEGDLWEARPEYGGIEYRFFLYFHSRSQIGIVHAVVKKKQKLDRGIIDLALRLVQETREQLRVRKDE